MKRAFAAFLYWWASKLAPDHKERVEVRDEYDIPRVRVIIIADDFVHHAETTLVQLPPGWTCEAEVLT